MADVGADVPSLLSLRHFHCMASFREIRALGAVVIAAALFYGCATASVPESRVPEATRPTVEKDPLAPPWRIHRTGQARTHSIQINTLLESRIDSTVSSDTFNVEMIVSSGSPSLAFPQIYSGTINSYMISLGADSVAVPSSLTLPVQFVTEQTTAQQPMAIVRPLESDCADPAGSIVSLLRDLWYTAPDSLYPGVSWQDSLETSICRDSIPLVVVTVRDFRVTGVLQRGGVTAVSIERRTSTSVSGTGLQFGVPISLRGHGRGDMMLEVSLDGGQVIFASGDNELTLEMESARRNQIVTQRSRISIVER